MYKGTYTLVGQELSMFTRKLEAQLLYQGIPFQWQYKTFDSSPEIDARAGTRFIPLLETPDGWFLSDTISIGPMLNDRFKKRPVIPKSPNQRSVCFVLEDFFNHWLSRHALHSRWCYPDNIEKAGQNFAMNLLLGRSITSERTTDEDKQIEGFGQIMYNSFGANACVTQGAGEDQKEAIQRDFKQIMGLLATHLQENNFLLGDRACIADFALIGSLKGHFLLDPQPKSWLGSHAQLFENYVNRASQVALPNARWMAGDDLPDSIHVIFDYMINTYQKFAHNSITAAHRGEKFFSVDLGSGSFTARSMKRLDKARLHVQEELIRCRASDSAINFTGILDYYFADYGSR